METKVNIVRTSINGDNTAIDYSIQSLNINGSLMMPNDDFVSAISKNGYSGIGEYILNYVKNKIVLLQGGKLDEQ